jgi:pimeloyl-ACP methyl ester carboxylesterase
LEREFGDVVPDEGCMWDEPDCPLSQAYVDDLTQIKSVLPNASEVMIPWLFIHGDADDVVPIEDSRQAFAVARGDKKLIEVPEAGHMFGEENYQQIVNAIDAWLTKSFG